MLELFAKVFQTFGAIVFVPVVLFIVALFAGVKPKSAVSSALSAGIGLTGFNLVMNSFTPILVPLVDQIVKDAGINKNILDTGWQSTSIVGYSSNMGLLYFAIAIGIQLAIFILKLTDCFMVGDLWNNYSYMVWGSIIYVITQSVFIAMSLMIVQTLYTALFSEVLEKRFSTYYKYPNCALVSPHNLECLPFAMLMSWLLNKLRFDKINLNPKRIQEKFGLMGEPMFLGLFVGAILGVIGNFSRLNQLVAWGQIAQVAITTSAVMVIYPKIAGIFAGAFAPITAGFNKKASKSSKNRSWYLGVNPAVSVGETATLTTGLLCIPLLLGISFILPGNQVLPVVDLITLPSMSIVFTCVNNGNISKGLVSAIMWFTAGLFVATYAAPYYTEVATAVGISIPNNAVMICSYVILAKPLLGALFFAFLSRNPIIIGSVILLYVLLTILFKKYKGQVHAFLEKEALFGTQAYDEAQKSGAQHV